MQRDDSADRSPWPSRAIRVLPPRAIHLVATIFARSKPLRIQPGWRFGAGKDDLDLATDIYNGL